MRKSALISTIALATYTQAWGELGHKTVANIALNYLPDANIESINKVLANDPDPLEFDDDSVGSIVSVASWADQFDHTGGPVGVHTMPYHFLDANDEVPRRCEVNMTRDCPEDGPGCVVRAINKYTQELLGPNDSDGPNDADRARALKFVVHFIGDITQPLHVEGANQGENKYHINWHGQNRSLHSIWDGSMIYKIVHAKNNKDSMKKLNQWTRHLVGEIDSGIYTNQVSEWISCTDVNNAIDCALEWATQTNKLVCEYAVNPQMLSLDDDLSHSYYDGAAPIIEEQIAKAGVRLAVWLNQIYGSGQPGQLPAKTDDNVQRVAGRRHREL